MKSFRRERNIGIVGVGNLGIKIVSYLIGKNFDKESAICLDPDIWLNNFESKIECEEVNFVFDDYDNLPSEYSALFKRFSKVLGDWIANFDIVIIIAGVGGRHGGIISTALSQWAKSKEKIMIGAFITPFRWEGEFRLEMDKKSINEIRQVSELLFIFSNEKALEEELTIPYILKRPFDIIGELIRNFRA